VATELRTRALVGERSRRFRLGYRPELDGMRAVAVAVVMLYHAYPTFGGGYLGVDVFFVLSGFLITTLLIQEREADGGVSLPAFYIRRALRLLPALAVLLAGVAAYALIRPGAPETHLVWRDSTFAAGYVANWSFALQGDLFQGPTRMLSHTWSLGVEEQFYLIWPVTLVLLLRMRNGRRRALVVAAVAAVGLQLERIALYLHGASFPRLSFGLDVRAGALMLGVVVALLVTTYHFVPGRVTARTCAVVGTVGLAAIVLSERYGLSAIVRDPGRQFVEGIVAVDVVSALLLVGLLFDRSGPIAWILSRRPLVWIGKVSYGLYLFHLPVFEIVTTARTGLPSPLNQVARLAVTFAVVVASYELLERPALRLKSRFADRVARGNERSALLMTAPSTVA
jgi:peptidoglycan/LPS O-acetylase OafA/YrhL